MSQKQNIHSKLEILKRIEPTGEASYLKTFEKLIHVIEELRRPVTGCPWDLEQNPKTMCEDLIEECYELIEAIQEENPEHVKEEIGDLLLNALMVAYMNQQDNHFTFSEVFESISSKLIRRHPHVFGDLKVKDSDEVLKNWAEIKTKIEGRKTKSILEQIPLSYPPLERGYKIQKKASKCGFDWEKNQIESVLSKVEEELNEVKAEIQSKCVSKQRIQEECGDLLFSVINLCRNLEVNPMVALDETNRKFVRRFKYIESKMNEKNISLSQEHLSQMNQFWEEAKAAEKNK